MKEDHKHDHGDDDPNNHDHSESHGHSHSHNHNHGIGGSGNIEKGLKFAIVLTFVFFVVEIIGGFMSSSLSLLGDAGHMLRDVFALMLSLGAVGLARKLPSKTKTFGYHRIEVFAAFINGIFLIIISFWIFIEAFQRYFDPEPIESGIMFIVAVIGLIVNIIIAFSLHGSDDLNVRSAFIHVLTDLISSVGVIIASVWIYFTGQTIVDPIVGFAIAIFILVSSIKIIRESVHILLEFTPPGIDFDDVVKDIQSVKGVEDVNNVHLWSLCSHINVVDAHVLTNASDLHEVEQISKDIKAKLQKYNVKHATLEFECEACDECQNGCVIDSKVKVMEH